MSGTFDRAVRDVLYGASIYAKLPPGAREYADEHTPRVAAELRAALLAELQTPEAIRRATQLEKWFADAQDGADDDADVACKLRIADVVLEAAAEDFPNARRFIRAANNRLATAKEPT